MCHMYGYKSYLGVVATMEGGERLVCPPGVDGISGSTSSETSHC